jgi:poly(A) polymerase
MASESRPNPGEEGPTPIRFPDILETVFHAFESRGFPVYLIGPRARDLANGKDLSEDHSFDLTVDASMTQITGVFYDLFEVHPHEEREERSRILTFRIARGRRVKDGESPHWTFNVGPFRNYLPPLRSLRGQNLSGILLDLATREVTIQAFAYTPRGELLDPFGGTRDLHDRVIRPVFPCETIFRESGAWLLKMARYVARYGFEPAPEARAASERDASNILDVPREIWLREMEKILCGAYPGVGLQYMSDVRTLSFILPEVASLVGFTADEVGQHKDVWEHTKQVVTNADPTPVIRWAALCHDIGKVWTRQVFQGDKVHFFRHEDMSALLFEGIAARLRMPAEDARRIHFIIKNHSRINLYREDWTDSAVRRLIRDVGEHLDDLIAFSRADLTSKRVERVERIRSLLAELQIRILEIREADEAQNPLPKGIGNRIMERYGLSPGPEVGRLRALLLQAIQQGHLPANAADEVYLEYLDRVRPNVESAEDA